MNIQDILRGLPFPMQGALMQAFGATANSPVPQQGAGGGRGFVNPPLVTPNAAPPQMAQSQPSRPAQVSKDEGGFEDLISKIMAGNTGTQGTTPAMQGGFGEGGPSLPPVSQAMTQESGATGTQGTTPAMQGGFGEASVEAPGILSRMGFADGNQALMAFGGALAAAGSQDPAKTALAIQAQKAEEAKIAEARRRSMMPKVDHIPGTPYFQITKPDGTTEMTSNPALAKFYNDQSASKAAAKRSDMELQAELNAKATAGKADIKASEEAKPLLNDIQSLKGRWTQAKDIVANQGVGAQLQGIPGIAGVAGFFGGDEVAKNKFLEGLTVDETLLNTARTKGAISNQEMMLFKSPIPSITDDREKVWKPWIEKRLEVLDKMEKYQAGEVARAPAPAATSTPAPAASGGVSAPTSKADFDKLPSGTRFRAPDGSIRIKP